MDLKQLRQFVTLSETLNFRRAAERLHIAQPALSLSIRRLEVDLGVALFERGRRGVVPTDAGAAALPQARLALQHAARMREDARAALEGDVGTVRLSFVGSATYALLPRLLGAFRARHPRVQVQLSESSTRPILVGLDSGDFDLAIVRFPLICPAGMLLDELERDTYWIALSPDHRLAKRKRLALSELADEPFVMPGAARSPSLHDTAMTACQLAGFTPRIAQEATQLQTAVCLVESGVGVALIPSSVVHAMKRRAVFRPLTDLTDRLGMGLGLLYREGALNRASQQFRDLACQGRAPARPAAGRR